MSLPWARLQQGLPGGSLLFDEYIIWPRKFRVLQPSVSESLVLLSNSRRRQRRGPPQQDISTQGRHRHYLHLSFRSGAYRRNGRVGAAAAPWEHIIRFPKVRMARSEAGRRELGSLGISS